jgi:hypothetical protein
MVLSNYVRWLRFGCFFINKLCIIHNLANLLRIVEIIESNSFQFIRLNQNKTKILTGKKIE